MDHEAFYQADHQVIFDVLVKLYEMNRPSVFQRMQT